MSFAKRQAWHRAWKRRLQTTARQIEFIGFKLLPHRPDADPDTWWTQLKKRQGAFIDKRGYPVEARIRHSHALRHWWNEFTSPFRQGSRRVKRWLDRYLLPTLTAKGFRKRFYNWKGLACLLVAAGTVISIPFWVLPEWSLHNKEKWAAQAQLLSGRGYYNLAYQYATRVLRKDMHHVQASHVIADMLDRQGLPDAIAWRRRVADGDKSISNQLALAATAVRVEPSPSATAARIFAGLPDKATNLVAYHTVRAQYELRGGNPAKAESHYLAALEQTPDDIEIQFALAQVRLQMRNPAKLALAEQSLLTISAQTNMTARALRPLIALAASRGDYAKGIEHSTRIVNAESPTLEDRLVHLGLLYQKRDPQRQIQLRTLQAQVSANPAFIAQVAAWMTANGMALDTIKWIEILPEPIQRSDPSLLAQADAYVSLADWTGLERFLLKKPWGTIEFVRQAMLARAYRGLKELRTATSYFARAKDLAAGTSSRLVGLTRMVASWGWENETDELLWEILDRYPKETWAADSLLRRHWERGNTEGLRQVFEVQLRRSPNDASLKNNLAMVTLLLNQDLPQAHRLALEAHEQVPQSAVNTSTYAFSLFIQGRTAESRRQLESLDRETLKVPSLAAYYTILAAATGDTNTAREYMVYARQAKLLPEEKALLDRIRSQL